MITEWFTNKKHAKNCWKVDLCTLHKALCLVIPPNGITIFCPIHKKGHFIMNSSPMFSG